MKSRLILALLLAMAAAMSACIPSPVLPQGSGPAFTAHVEGSGPPMILIAGLASSGEVWAQTVEHYRAHHRVHVLQLAGAAGNAPMSGPYLNGVRDALVRYVQDQHLDHPVVIGHSFGGVAALAAAEVHPELFSAVISVDGVPFGPALVDPDATPAAMQRKARLAQALLSRLNGGEDFANVWRKQVQGMVSSPEELSTLIAWAKTSNPQEVALAQRELMTTDLRAGLAAAKLPILLIGSHTPQGKLTDAELKTRYDQQLSAAPDARVMLPPHALHFVMLDDAPFFLSTVDGFLAAEHKS